MANKYEKKKIGKRPPCTPLFPPPLASFWAPPLQQQKEEEEEDEERENEVSGRPGVVVALGQIQLVLATQMIDARRRKKRSCFFATYLIFWGRIWDNH